MVHEKYAQCKFEVYVPADAIYDAAFCSKFVAFILGREESKPTI